MTFAGATKISADFSVSCLTLDSCHSSSTSAADDFITEPRCFVTIFFSNYIINDNTIKELKRQREQIKLEIQRNDSRFKCYSL